MRGVRWSLSCVLIVIVAGCIKNQHVAISPPPSPLSPELRVATFSRYRQAGRGAEVRCSQTGCSEPEEILLLADRTEVRDAEDLLPVLPPQSAAANTAREIGDVRRRKESWIRRMRYTILAGVAVMAAGFATDNEHVFIAGVGVLVLPALPIGVIVWRHNRTINEKTRFVFGEYDERLAEHLDVCVNGLGIVPCEALTSGIVPPAPDPALNSLRQK